MTNVVRGDFKGQLRSIAARLPPRYRRRGRRDIESVLRTGVRSRADLLAVLKNRASDPNIRSRVCWILGRLRDKRSAPAIIAAVEDPDPRLRQAAAQALGEIGSRRAFRALVAALQDEDVEVRVTAASSLGALRDGRAFLPLVDVLNNRREDPRVRGMAAEALAAVPHRRAADVLVAMLSDRSAEVRLCAAFALGQLRSPKALRKLKRLAATDRARPKGWGAVKDEAARAIEYIQRHGFRATRKPPTGSKSHSQC